MKKPAFRNICCLLIMLISEVSAVAQNEEKYFSARQIFLTGTGCLPVSLSAEDITAAMNRIAGMGFDFTIIGEASWTSMEPHAGIFDFSWLDKCLEEASHNKLKVIICVPLVNPPVWLTKLHPDLLLVNQMGDTADHGKANNVNPSNAVFRYYAKRLLGQLASHYGRDRRVWGWMLDEPGNNINTDCSATALSGFHSWLMDKYQFISLLNKTWQYDSLYIPFNSFDEVPHPLLTKEDYTHGRAMEDYSHYIQETIVSIIKYQADTLHKTVSPLQFICSGTNPSTYNSIAIPALYCRELNFITYTDESISHKGIEFSLNAAIAKSFAGYSGILLKPQAFAGGEQMALWHAFAMNEKFICTGNLEQYTTSSTIQIPPGKTHAASPIIPEGGKIIQTLQEIKALQKYYDPKAQEPEEIRKRRTACYLGNAKYSAHTRTEDGTSDIQLYSLLKRMGCPVSFFNRNNLPEPDQYPFFILNQERLDDMSMLSYLEGYVRSGGNLILYSTNKNNNKVKQKNDPDSALDMLCSKEKEVISEGARYAKSSIGKGNVFRFNTHANEISFLLPLLRKIWIDSGADVLELPPDVFLGWRSGFLICLNYSQKPVTIPHPKNDQLLLGTEIVEPGRVSVWFQK